MNWCGNFRIRSWTCRPSFRVSRERIGLSAIADGLSLEDVRTIFRQPTTPDGITDFSGHASYASEAAADNQWAATGYYKGHDIKTKFTWFHAAGLESSGDYTVGPAEIGGP